MMRFVSALGRDARHGLRSLAGSSRYTVVALSTVVLMVGGITTIYSLVNSVLLRPLPYPTPDRLAWIESRQPGGFGSTVALRDIRAFQQGGRSFDAWGLYRIGYVTSVFDPNREPVSVQDMRVSPDLFPILGIETALGRALLESDTAPGAPDVALISYDLWQSLFSGRADVLGTSLQVWKSTATIVGVTAKDTKLPMNGLTYPIVWRPVRDATDSAVSFTTIARLRPGVSVAQARAELAVAGEALAAAQPDTHKGRVTTPTLLLDAVVGDYKRVLWIFFGAVSCVLLIGVGNLMSLQLARNGGRERELSVRTALGASRGQIVRQLLVESSILSIAGGVLGLALAWPAIQSIVSTLPRNFPRASQIGIDVGVAVFACAISLVVGVVVGMVPAWRASRIDLAARLNESGRSATLGRQRGRLQRVLIALETAVALILLIGAALLANSFQRLISRDAGMQEEDLWTVRATLPSRVRDNAAQTAFWTSALDEVRKLPGVQSAAIIVNSSGPLSGGDILEGGIVPEGYVGSPRDGLRVSARRVSGNYFSTVGTPLVKGRPILESDVDGAEDVVVVNELTAASLWPGQDPIGKRLRSRGRSRTVVGVIPTFRHARLDADVAPQMFTSYRQQPSIASSSAIMVRTAPGNRQAAAAAKDVVTRLEKDAVVLLSSMADVRWRLLAAERFRVTVLLVFAATAVFLALVGIVGLVVYSVGQRRREIAVRVALGAVRRDVLNVALRQVIAPAFAGLALGILGAVFGTRLLSTYLVDVRPLDLPTFALSAAMLAIAALLAGLVPARQALRIDPVEALRQD